MATHRLGLVMHGVTGRMGLNQHLKRSILAIRDAGGVALANGDRVVPEPLLLGRNDRKLRAIARATGLDAYTTDYDAAIRSAEHSLFFDAGATLMRSELIGKAIAAGKHVYCEKPVAGSLAAALEVCERAEAAGVKAGVVMDKLFLPGLIKLAQLKADGFFGRILSVQIDFGYWVFTGEGTPSNRPSWNYRTRDGGGIIFDMMAHWRYVLDRIVAPDAPFPSGSADDDRCASRANLPARRTRDTATTRGARGHPIAIGSRWGNRSSGRYGVQRS